MKNQISTGWKHLWWGFKNLSIGIARLINLLAHESPWLFMTMEFIIFTMLYVFTVGPARQERDNLQQTSYQMEQKLQQLQIAYDSVTHKLD